MKQIVVLTRLEVKPGHDDLFRKQVGQYVKAAVDNEHNIMAEAYYEEGNASLLWLIERWSKEAVIPDKKLFEKELMQPAKTIYVKDLEPLSKQEWRMEPGMNDTPITIMLFVDCQAGTEDRFKDIYHIAMPQFRSEPGVVNYQLSQLQEDSTQFVTYEKFRNEAAFQYHLHFSPIQPVIDYLNSSIKKQPFQAGLHRLIRFAPFSK